MGLIFSDNSDDRTVDEIIEDGATIEAKADNGQIVSTPRKVVCKFDGVLATMDNLGEGDVTIFYDSIRGIEFKKAGMVRRGTLEIQQSGAENVDVQFTSDKNDEMEQVKELIEARIHENN